MLWILVQKLLDVVWGWVCVQHLQQLAILLHTPMVIVEYDSNSYCCGQDDDNSQNYFEHLFNLLILCTRNIITYKTVVLCQRLRGKIGPC